MGIVIRQSIQNSIISYTGVVLGFVNTVLIFPKILSPDQFGLTRFMISVAVIAMHFSTVGTSNSIINFFPRFKTPNGKHHGFFWLFLLPVLAGLSIVFGVILLFKDSIILHFEQDSALIIQFFNYLFPLIGAFTLFLFLSNYAKALKQTVLFSGLQDIGNRVLVLAVLLLYNFDVVDFEQFMILFVLSYAIVALFLLLHLLINKHILPAFDRKFISKALVKEIFTFSFFGFLGGTSGILVSNIDIMMVSTLTNLSQTAVYTLALYVGMVISIPLKAVQKISYPIVNEAFKIGDMKKVSDFYRRTSLNQLAVGLLLFIGVLGNLHNLFSILPPEYAGGAVIFFVIGLANLFDLATGINSSIVLASPFYKHDLYATVSLLVVAVFLNFMFIPVWGINGAAFATAISIFIYNTYKCAIVWKRLKMQPFHLGFIELGLVAWVVYYGSKVIPYLGNVILDITIRSLAMSIAFAVMMYVLRISKDMNDLVDQLFRKFRTR